MDERELPKPDASSAPPIIKRRWVTPTVIVATGSSSTAKTMPSDDDFHSGSSTRYGLPS
jgi:hypothetical protein